MIVVVLMIIAGCLLAQWLISGRWAWQPTWTIRARPNVTGNGIIYRIVDRRFFGPIYSFTGQFNDYDNYEDARRILDRYLQARRQAKLANQMIASKDE